MSKLTLRDVQRMVNDICNQKNYNVYIHRVSENASRPNITIQLAKLTYHGLRTVESIVIKLQDIEPDEIGIIYNYFSEIARTHRKATRV